MPPKLVKMELERCALFQARGLLGREYGKDAAPACREDWRVHWRHVLEETIVDQHDAVLEQVVAGLGNHEILVDKVSCLLIPA